MPLGYKAVCKHAMHIKDVNKMVKNELINLKNTCLARDTLAVGGPIFVLWKTEKLFFPTHQMHDSYLFVSKLCFKTVTITSIICML